MYTAAFATTSGKRQKLQWKIYTFKSAAASPAALIFLITAQGAHVIEKEIRQRLLSPMACCISETIIGLWTSLFSLTIPKQKTKRKKIRQDYGPLRLGRDSGLTWHLDSGPWWEPAHQQVTLLETCDCFAVDGYLLTGRIKPKEKKKKTSC